LGRNLITLFSTVNTLCEKNFRAAPCRRVARGPDDDMRAARIPVDSEAAAADVRNKTSFFQRFYL
jgi:hypothetical protein